MGFWGSVFMGFPPIVQEVFTDHLSRVLWGEFGVPRYLGLGVGAGFFGFPFLFPLPLMSLVILVR